MNNPSIFALTFWSLVDLASLLNLARVLGDF